MGLGNLLEWELKLPQSHESVSFSDADMCSIDFNRVDAGDSVKKIVSFVDDDNVAFQLHTHSLASWSVKESIVRENN